MFNIDKSLKKMMSSKKLKTTNFSNKILGNFNLKSMNMNYFKPVNMNIQTDMFSKDHRYGSIKDTKQKRIFKNPEGKKIIYYKDKLPKGHKLPPIDDVAYIFDELPPYYHDPKTEVRLISRKKQAEKSLKKYKIPKDEYKKAFEEEQKSLKTTLGQHQSFMKPYDTTIDWGWEKGKPKFIHLDKQKRDPGQPGSIKLYPMKHYGEEKEYIEKGPQLKTFKLPDEKIKPIGFKKMRGVMIHEIGHSVHDTEKNLAVDWEDRVRPADAPTTYGSSTYFTYSKPDYNVEKEDFAESFTLYHLPKTGHKKIMPLSKTRKHLFDKWIGGSQKSSREIAEEAHHPHTLIKEGFEEYEIKTQKTIDNATGDNDRDGLINAADPTPDGGIENDKESKDKRNDKVRWIKSKEAMDEKGKIKPGYKWRVFPDKNTGDKIGIAVFEGLPLKKAIEIVKQPWHKTEEEKIDAVIKQGGQKSTARQALMHARGRRGMPATSVKKRVHQTEWEREQEGVERINTSIGKGEFKDDSMPLYEEVEEVDFATGKKIKVMREIKKEKKEDDKNEDK